MMGLDGPIPGPHPSTQLVRVHPIHSRTLYVDINQTRRNALLPLVNLDHCIPAVWRNVHLENAFDLGFSIPQVENTPEVKCLRKTHFIRCLKLQLEGQTVIWLHIPSIFTRVFTILLRNFMQCVQKLYCLQKSGMTSGLMFGKGECCRVGHLTNLTKTGSVLSTSIPITTRRLSALICRCSASRCLRLSSAARPRLACCPRETGTCLVSYIRT